MPRFPGRAGLAKPGQTCPESAMIRWVLTTFALVWGAGAVAGDLTVAVASNFLTTAEEIVAGFEKTTGHSVALSHGSTGQLYAQIDLGAPFDIYLAADQERPALLLASGKATEVRTYALGQLVVAARIPVSRESAAEAFAGRTVALADPIVAPYGKAATTAMEKLKLDTASFRPVLVTNVGQVGSVFATGNADIAFVAKSQLPRLDAPFTLDLAGIVSPISQDAARLARSEGNEAADAFWAWLFSAEAAQVIEAAGYGLPDT